MAYSRGLRSVVLNGKQATAYLLDGLAVDGLVVGTRFEPTGDDLYPLLVEGRVICYPTGEVTWTGELRVTVEDREAAVDTLRKAACYAALIQLHLACDEPARPCRLALVMTLGGDSCQDHHLNSSSGSSSSSCVEVGR